MKKRLKTVLIVSFAIILIASIFIWRFLGNLYYRFNPLRTEYIENAEELIPANERLISPLILIRKYKYSEDVWLIGFGGGTTQTNDYYAFGVADKKGNILLEPKYQFISSAVNSNNDPIISGLPYVEKGDEKMQYYKIGNGRLEPIDERASW